VTEAFSATGEVFGNARLETRLAELAAAGPGEMIAGVSASIAAFARGVPQSDDLTGLALRFEGSAAEEAEPVQPL
jgi:serine phosphatase RsbU (regulator of sigma subunit)